jgi:hypothetical protein
MKEIILTPAIFIIPKTRAVAGNPLFKHTDLYFTIIITVGLT